MQTRSPLAILRAMQSGSNILSQGYLFAFATVFVGGFLTSLTPCVYPLISVTVSIFGARDENVSRARSMLLASCYVAGIAVTYTSLGIGFALTGRALAFGSFLANWKIVVPLALIFVAMAASMFGAFELSLPTGLQTRLSTVGGKGFAGAFLMGLVGGIIAAPCTGPVLASILAYVATTRSVALGGGLLFTYAIGMGVLFFVVAAFASSLPRSGRWMETVKSVLGVVMIGAALYFLRNVWPTLASFGTHTLRFVLASGLLVLVGIAAGGLSLSFHGAAREKLRKALGIALIVGGGFGVIAWFMATPAEAAELKWIRGESEGVAAAKAAQKPAFLDFYADWCLPCKELDIKTFHQPEVSAEFQRFQLVKVDCTKGDDDPAVMATQSRYGAATLPTLVMIGSDGQIAKKIDHFVGKDELLAALRSVH
jgi:thioredoxin:protein disulfide reductase